MTAAAVVLVDGAVLGVLLPRLLASSSRASTEATVAGRASADARWLSQAVADMAGRAPAGANAGGLLKELAFSQQAAALGLSVSGGKASGPDRLCASARTAEVLMSVGGTVIASSSPRECPPGMGLNFAVRREPWGRSGGQRTLSTAGRAIVWAVSPVEYLPGKTGGLPAASGTPGGPAPGSSFPAGKGTHVTRFLTPGQVVGVVYAEAPAATRGFSFAQVRPLLFTGGLALALVVPVGTVFGLLSTRRVIRRIKRLADVTATVAGGDFRPRVLMSGGDEIGRLEDAFNRMTGRLSVAVDAERVRAGTDARQAERARIARELHDSISQDLFSLSLLAAGLRKALSGDSALRPEVTAMERTSARAMREMQALLLELRPVALEDAGLVPAVTELCQAYQVRLAIKVTAELGEVSLGLAAEHAVLRIIQEALG
ncbi:MAG TPA: histidine kinase, partial [Streptosporangiaceae bacterium]